MATYLELGANKKRGLNWDAVNITSNYGDSDIILQDLTALPIRGVPGSYYDGVFSEHFIEHFYKYQGINIFNEAKRVLKPGGVFRTTMPAYDFIEYLVGPDDLSQDEFVKHYYERYIVQEKFCAKGHAKKRIQEQVALGLLYQKGEHLYLWGIEEMKETLNAIGFTSVKEVKYGKSSIGAFNNIETPGKIRELHSTVIEAKKPW
tara:strand:+ start:8256 stop:8867 length:612 start_codon:yes stop_codon:yes gene_type:complete